MANRIIIQNCETAGKLDILVKVEGCHAEHYCRIFDGQEDETVEEAKAYVGKDAEVQDLRAGR